MSTAQVSTISFTGIQVNEVQVQTTIIPGFPKLMIVGLPDKIIAEAKERVAAALHSLSIALPSKKILINLSPANLIKEGSHFDLPIALSLLAKLGILPDHELQKYLAMGELALNGEILSVHGVLPAAIGASGLGRGLICPEKNGSEAAWSGNDSILAPRSLLCLINHFRGSQQMSAPKCGAHPMQPDTTNIGDFQDVIGQDNAKRALEIAAAGHHNVLLIGSPGSGKSMLSHSFPGILPPMTTEEILETSMLYSIAGEIKTGQLQCTRPFRSPHHSASIPALVGGGHSKRITPGEISLAHNGVLFLDEFPEFPRAVLDALRQPMEAGTIGISRAEAHVDYPANFQLIAAMNHCKCANFKNPKKMCSRAPICVSDYMRKIPGPILDRIDMFVEVDETTRYGYGSARTEATTNGQACIPEHATESNCHEDSSSDCTVMVKPCLETKTTWTNSNPAETSTTILRRVEDARAIQANRFAGTSIRTNSKLNGAALQQFAELQPDAADLLEKFAHKYKISLRSYNRLLRVSRTIADLAGQSAITKPDVAEAINFRTYYSV